MSTAPIPGVEYLSWEQIASASTEAGVYAWYFSPTLTLFDINEITTKLALLDPADQEEARCGLMRAFLDRLLFKFLREEPYRARMEGALKQTYLGNLHHELQISVDLVKRLAAEPQRLHHIRKILDLSAPMFASPLYIGMSNSLRQRLLSHKRLIERFRENRTSDYSSIVDGENSFAIQVVKREMPTDRLHVAICAVPDGNGVHVDIENILNRLYFPVLGRN